MNDVVEQFCRAVAEVLNRAGIGATASKGEVRIDKLHFSGYRRGRAGVVLDGTLYRNAAAGTNVAQAAADIVRKLPERLNREERVDKHRRLATEAAVLAAGGRHEYTSGFHGYELVSGLHIGVSGEISATDPRLLIQLETKNPVLARRVLDLILILKRKGGLECEGDQILRELLEAPDEDTTSLVYADWLQERGDDERAERIREAIARRRQ